jgi:predicted  nucleic acid-binding Zn-ribbon protein
MKRKKLLNKLAEFLDMKGRKQRKHRDDLEELLVKLTEKKAGLEKELLREKDGHKRKRLGKELDIIRAQYAKGEQALRDLAKH